jgi:hypothetical protein
MDYTQLSSHAPLSQYDRYIPEDVEELPYVALADRMMVPGQVWLSVVNGRGRVILLTKTDTDDLEGIYLAVKNTSSEPGTSTRLYNDGGIMSHSRLIRHPDGTWAGTAPVNPQRFPHRCPDPGCGQPAYIGCVPAAVECSLPSCRHYRG